MEEHRLIGFRHIGIIVNKMEESIRFYRDLLGFTVAQDWTEDSAYLNTVLGTTGERVRMAKLRGPDGILVELLRYEKNRSGELDLPFWHAGVCHMALTVADVGATWKKLSAAGVPFVSPPQESTEGTAKVCFCTDPNGIRVELVEIKAAAPR
ncbi:MAG: VOC family protein [Spirochaetes bacterium]|nr:VOC family protein [Spirochaetota bacterium]